MFKKKLLALSLVAALSFTACQKKAETTPETTPAPTETVETTPEATEEPTPEITEEAANEEQASEGEEAVDNGAVASNETLDAIHDKVLEKFGEEYVANMPYPADSIAELFGIQPDWYDAAIAEGPMMMVHVDKFIAVKATEGNLENVQNALNAYRDTLVADTMQYPSNLLKIQGSVVETVGDYVFFVMLGFVDDTAFDSDDAIIAEYQKINNEVIDLAKAEINQ